MCAKPKGPPSSNGSVYRDLGINPIINAAGTFTQFGGSLMPPEVLDAWRQAATSFVDMTELQEAVGRRISELLNVPAALVTGGAAHSILLGVASAITSRDPGFVNVQYSLQSKPPWEVLRPASHRDLYDRQVLTAGVNIIDVESIADARRRVNERTLLLMSYNVYETEGSIKHSAWLEFARELGLPTLLDAAADTPPVHHLRRYVQMGYDMVAFSGGKALRGPQDSGLLLGTPTYIALANRNASPIEGTIGRVAKVSKEDMVALCRAVELFVEQGDDLANRCLSQLEYIASALGALPITCRFVTPEIANSFPHLQLTWNEARVSFTADDLARRLRSGHPPIATGRVYGTGDSGLLLSAVNLQSGEEQVLSARLLEILGPILSQERSPP